MTKREKSTQTPAPSLDTLGISTYNSTGNAGMAEMADAADLKTLPTIPAYPTSLNLTYSQLIERSIASRRDGLSPRTIHKCYRSYLKRSKDVVGLNVTGDDIQRFISSRSCSGGGKHAYFRCLRTFYNWLYSPKSGLGLKMYNNPILAVMRPKLKKNATEPYVRTA